MRIAGPCIITSLLAIAVSGCSTGPFGFMTSDEHDTGLERGSAEWWAERALDPPGVRQRCKKGKMWPVRPRPTGERQQFTHTFHSEHYWPLPYNCQDRAYVRDIIHSQERNGWTAETTLYDRHFETDQQLNVPGQLHLVDIMEVTPSRYRTVYVQSSYNTEIDNVRVANVEQAVAQLTGGREVLPVVLRTGRDYSRPASEVKIINDLYNDSVPTPRLGGAAGGGGGGGGAATPAVGP